MHMYIYAYALVKRRRGKGGKGRGASERKPEEGVAAGGEEGGVCTLPCARLGNHAKVVVVPAT